MTAASKATATPFHPERWHPAILKSFDIQLTVYILHLDGIWIPNRWRGVSDAAANNTSTFAGQG
jgi:hypothetical protein